MIVFIINSSLNNCKCSRKLHSKWFVCLCFFLWFSMVSRIERERERAWLKGVRELVGCTFWCLSSNSFRKNGARLSWRFVWFDESSAGFPINFNRGQVNKMPSIEYCNCNCSYPMDSTFWVIKWISWNSHFICQRKITKFNIARILEYCSSQREAYNHIPIKAPCIYWSVCMYA